MYEILRSIPWVGWVPIVAIICSAIVILVTFTVKAIHHHEVRMEMIKQGMDPSKIGDES